ncbi:MAG: low molecular weight protein-tyrosine-phosphatase [Flavobacteriaceae bacterium]|jgi:protein-tyrosine phosphatase
MRILMVCLGNICRSPLAEGILKSKLNANFEVDSAGTAAYHVGNPPDKRSIAVAQQFGIDISQQRARQFKKDDFNSFDLIFVMDQNNYNDVVGLATPAQRRKVHLLRENNEVPDPYYGDASAFEAVFHLIDTACETLVKKYCNG